MSAPQDALTKLLAGQAFTESGWEGMQAGASLVSPEEAARARYEEAHIIAAPFMTPAGRISLAKLRETTIERPTWLAEGRGGFYDAAAYGFAREGQNSIIHHILLCIRIVEDGPPMAAAQAKPKAKTKTSVPTS